MLYLMSTTVIPHGADGVWPIATISTGQAIELVESMIHTSAVGHESSAEAMSAALGAPVAANRITVFPAPGDRFLCMRLHRRPPEGVILDRAALDQIGFSWALMTYHG